MSSLSAYPIQKSTHKLQKWIQQAVYIYVYVYVCLSVGLYKTIKIEKYPPIWEEFGYRIWEEKQERLDVGKERGKVM